MGQKVKHYTVVVEKALHNYSGYVPDLPGCITTGKTVDEVIANMHEAIAVHLETMEELGIPIPEPSAPSDLPTSDGESLLVEVAD